MPQSSALRYISDGYGNCRVHQFRPTGELKRSWGTPGGGPGEFFLPHGIAVAADGRVFVCDRENDRIQIFSFAAPHGLAVDSRGDIYVAEVTWTFAVSRGHAREDCHTFQKFALKA